MRNKKNTISLQTAANKLRHQAEAMVLENREPLHPPRTEEELQRLVHELEVHQIELEMQNVELRHIREEVDKSLEKFTNLYDFAPVGYVTLDCEGGILSVNLSGASLLGCDREKLIGQHFTQLVTATDRTACTDFLHTVFSTKVKEACEVQLQQNGNQQRIVQIEAIVDLLAQECRLVLIDITGRRQVENALQESEGRLYKLAEMAGDAIVMMDDSGAVTFCNAAAETMFGCPADELTMCDFHHQFIPEQFLTTVEQGFARFKELGTGPLVGNNTEVVAHRKDGTEFPLELSISGLNLHGKWHAIGIMRDISERKRLEIEIQDAREYAENIVETVRRPLVVLSSDLKVLTANRNFYSTFNVTPEETIDKFIYDLGNRQWDIPALRSLLTEIVEQETGFNDYQVEHDFTGIGQKIILLNARQILQKNSGARVILLAMEDITERKRLETEIQDAREYAENIVETVREPLVVLNAELKVLTANHSFYETFKVTPDDTIGNFIYDLGNRQWDIPRLRVLVEEILPLDTVFNGYEVEHDFLDIGRKIILLNGRQIFREDIGSHIILLAMEDITDRKRLEAEIQDAREYAENIVETVREPLVVLNADLKILTANHSFFETFDVTPEDTIGNFIYDLGNRQWDIPRLRVLVEEILPHDTVINDYEVMHDFPGIGHKTILLNARQIFRENIGSHIILLAMEDITARKQLETEIQAAREYAENIVETVREPLVVLKSDLRILTANHSFYDTFKVTPDETIGNFIYDLGNRQWDIPKLRVLIEDILPLETVFNGYEVEHDFPGIGRKIIRLNAREISRKDFGSRVILLAMEDITERKLAEERISEVMRQQQAILDNIPNIAWLKDRNGRYVAVNEPFGREHGLAPKDLVGKNDFDIYPRELALKFDKNARQVMATGERTYFEEVTVDAEGKSTYVEKVKTPIYNDAGTVIGIIGIAHDITSRKEVEVTLRHDITNRKEVEVTLRHDNTHDSLTGLYNRAFFDEELERFAHGRMFPISLVMADVNGLKTVNDTLGHDAGDKLIRLAARIILSVFRAEDIVARIGGDEFAVLLPGTDATVAEEAVERIKNCPEISAGEVSIAFGIAAADCKDKLAEALKLSDERMYLDKTAQKES